MGQWQENCHLAWKLHNGSTWRSLWGLYNENPPVRRWEKNLDNVRLICKYMYNNSFFVPCVFLKLVHDKEISAEDEQVFLMKQQVCLVCNIRFLHSVLRLHIWKTVGIKWSLLWRRHASLTKLSRCPSLVWLDTVKPFWLVYFPSWFQSSWTDEESLVFVYWARVNMRYNCLHTQYLVILK